MIVIDRTIVSDDLLDRQFVCALDKCKGACCIDGESGAPLQPEEAKILEDILPEVKPFMIAEGLETVDKFGAWMVDYDGDLVTPLVNGEGQCAYVYFDKGIAKCAIERAFQEGKINFQKPVSCHLYPVRITAYENYDALNYDKRGVCSPACANGKALGVPLYQFVKNALIRKYGDNWYNQLKGAAEFAIAEKERNSE